MSLILTTDNLDGNVLQFEKNDHFFLKFFSYVLEKSFQSDYGLFSSTNHLVLIFLSVF